jgi:hypothetical protein
VAAAVGALGFAPGRFTLYGLTLCRFTLCRFSMRVFTPCWFTLCRFTMRRVKRRRRIRPPAVAWLLGGRARVYRPPARVGLPPLVGALAVLRCIAPLADLRSAGMRWSHAVVTT